MLLQLWFPGNDDRVEGDRIGTKNAVQRKECSTINVKTQISGVIGDFVFGLQ